MALNPFGVPVTPSGWEEAARVAAALVDPDLVAVDPMSDEPPPAGPGFPQGKGVYGVLELVQRDVQLIEATGRWRIQSGAFREPRGRLVPGDVLGVRALAASQSAASGDRDEVLVYRDVASVIDSGGSIRVLPSGLQLANLLYAAECYWLGGGGTDAALGSDPPSRSDLAALLLPHGHSAVWFAHPLEVPPELPLLPVELLDCWRDEYQDGDSPPEFVQAALGLRGVDANLPGVPGEMTVEGVVIAAADDDGRPHDLVVWVCRVARDTGVQRFLLPGLRSLAGWRALLDLLTAVVAWGDWASPAERLAVGPSRSELRALRQGRTRRAEEAGGLAAVRVLDVRRRPRDGLSRSGGSGGHASPITHLRRAHFRRVPVGPRGADREVRWIRPTVVNPGHEQAPTRIYRLPQPAVNGDSSEP